MHSDCSIMRRELKLAQDMHFMDLDIRLELMVWMAAQMLHWVCIPAGPCSALPQVLFCLIFAFNYPVWLFDPSVTSLIAGKQKPAGACMECLCSCWRQKKPL